MIEFNMKPHEYAALFPMMPDAEIQSLAKDIKENGQHEPIITLNGEILDGRNRYAACELAEISPWLKAYQGDDPLSFVIGHNLHRRHLNESQRAMVAVKLATMKKGHRSDLPPIGGRLVVGQEDAAKMMNVGTTTVTRASAVRKNGIPELQAAVERGDVSVSAAEVVARLHPDNQREAIEKGTLKEVAKTNQKSLTRVPSYQPSDAETIWQQAKLILDRILPNDKQREKVLREVVHYCHLRIKNKK